MEQENVLVIITGQVTMFMPCNWTPPSWLFFFFSRNAIAATPSVLNLHVPSSSQNTAESLSSPLVLCPLQRTREKFPPGMSAHLFFLFLFFTSLNLLLPPHFLPSVPLLFYIFCSFSFPSFTSLALLSHTTTRPCVFSSHPM